ncbi:MAG: threonine ammonia-lyase [Solirubrobacterales bacterium 70-9]|nr:MAG: threonine ammonia-lyase [Solirubrobacterales bacterium 70-9]
MTGWDPELAELRRIHAGSRDVVKETPVFSFGALSRRCGGQVVLKAENLQRTGSFKLRGTSAKLRTDAAGAARGVVTGSAGNHGQALAYAARARDLPCTIFMPTEAPVSKIEAVAAFGAEVRAEGGSVDDCVVAARELAAEKDLLFVHPFDDLDIVKGQAGVGLEIAAQVPDVARVIVPVGGGGLISGIAAAIKSERPEVEIVGVQASGCASLRASLAEGHPETVGAPSTIADGIAVKRPGDLTFALMERWLDDLAEVDDDAIAAAMVFLIERAKLATEGAGAVAVAALATGAVAPARTGTTVVVLSGGNVDANVLAAVINRAQTGAGRRVRFFTRISDRPGGLAGLLGQVAAAGGNLLDVTHVRDGVSLHVQETGVELLVECRSIEARRRLLGEMRAAGYDVEELNREETQ